MPVYHLLELYNSKTFKNPNATFNWYQDYTFNKSFFIVILSLGDETTLQLYYVFGYKYYNKHTWNYRKLNNFYSKNSNW